MCYPSKEKRLTKYRRPWVKCATQQMTHWRVKYFSTISTSAHDVTSPTSSRIPVTVKFSSWQLRWDMARGIDILVNRILLFCSDRDSSSCSRNTWFSSRDPRQERIVHRFLSLRKREAIDSHVLSFTVSSGTDTFLRKVINSLHLSDVRDNL